MTNKLIELIAFDEARLDANITDNMISQDGYMVLSEKTDQEMAEGSVFTCAVPSIVK